VERNINDLPKILIVGHARAGKDTVAQILADGWGFKFQSSSWAACEKVVFPKIKHLYGYETIEECFNDRVNHRAEWKDLISEYNEVDRTRLARDILEDSNIYVGLRCEKELKASHTLFDAIVWVDASYRKEPEPKSSNTITMDMADYVIDNNGSINDLIIETFKFMKWVNRNV
jgi:dephospho-CoA kinase